MGYSPIMISVLPVALIFSFLMYFQPGYGGLGMPPFGMDSMKPAGAHLNPAFLHDMAQNGAADPTKNVPQNMVRKQLTLACACSLFVDLWAAQ